MGWKPKLSIEELNTDVNNNSIQKDIQQDIQKEVVKKYKDIEKPISEKEWKNNTVANTDRYIQTQKQQAENNKPSRKQINDWIPRAEVDKRVKVCVSMRKSVFDRVKGWANNKGLPLSKFIEYLVDGYEKNVKDKI